MISRACLLALLVTLSGLSAHLVADEAEMQRVDMKPCLYVATDVGEDAKARYQQAREYAKPIAETSEFFLKVFNLKPVAFLEYARLYNHPDHPFAEEIRIRVWRRRADFMTDFQTRYESKAIPGAFFGIITPKDEYGKQAGPAFREIGAFAEGLTEEQVLRHLYHEMGHLFMRTFMLYPVEVPSWIEEGTAELFQYREGNGTNPEPDRRERLGWLSQMVLLEDTEVGASIPWEDFTAVRNAHNLAFTHENPLRSTVQYAQAWSVMEFMVSNRQRGKAFTKLLHIIKDTAKDEHGKLAAKGINGAKRNDMVDEAIYRQQYDFFKQAYGTDVLHVEEKWKEWIAETYEKQLKKEPMLRYHAGDWHLGYRARFAEGDKKAAILAQAEALFQEALDETPNSPAGSIGMGRLAMERGDAEAAQEWFAKAAELGAEEFEAQLYGGMALVRTGRAADAVEILAKAVEQRPTHYQANLLYGQALAIAGGQLEQALIHLERARDLKPDRGHEAAYIAAAAQYQAGQWEACRLSALRVQDGMKGHWMGNLVLAVGFWCEGRGEDAKKVLAQLTAQGGQGAAGAKRLEALIDAQKPIELGFGPDGDPGIVGLTIPAKGEL